jgi:hypothetical protein
MHVPAYCLVYDVKGPFIEVKDGFTRALKEKERDCVLCMCVYVRHLT